MADSEKRLLFRLQHIIPRLSAVSALPGSTDTSSLTPNSDGIYGPEEIEFHLTWGKIAAKAWGPRNGRPVLAIHGWLDNAATFDRLIPLLPKDLRIVCADIPGHGLSDHYPPDIAYHFNACLPIIQRIVKQLNWEKFYLIGHSLGGGMAVFFAEIFPEQVEKLVMLDIVRAQTTFPETMGNRLRKSTNVILKQEEAIIAGPEKPCSYETALKRSIMGSFNSLDVTACNALFTRGLTKVADGYVFNRDRRLRAAPLDFAPKDDQVILARNVTAEVLIIKCRDAPYFESPEYYEEQVEALRTNSKSLQYVHVDGNHHCHLTHPERIAPLITAFFNS